MNFQETVCKKLNGTGIITWGFILSLLIMMVLSTGRADAKDFYKWTDEEGTIHFTDSPSGIPPEYRDQIEKNSFAEEEPSTPETAPSPSFPPEELLQIPLLKKEKPPGRYEVPYKPFEGSARRVIVPVTINDSVTAPMAVDTGAPGMVISPNLAERLGLFDEEETKLLVMAGGLGGSVPAVRTIVDTVQVGGAKDQFIPTTVVPSISEEFEGLIGMDFMSNYSIKIDPGRQVLVFEEMRSNFHAPGGHDEIWWRTNFASFGTLRKAWKEYRDKLDREIESSLTVSERTKKLKAFSEGQFRAADKLFERLNRYAIQNAVPMNWRKY